MEALQQSLDQLQQNILQLNGAFNLQVEQMRALETRIGAFDARLNQQEANVNAALQRHAVQQQAEAVPITEQELETIKKLPDCVRDLQAFEGNPTQYVSWINNVESILQDYQVVRHKPIYRAILKHIRQKVRGPADNALVSYNVFNDEWDNIKKCLSLHYADKRDIQSLENQLNLLRQNRDSVDEFYNKVNYQLSLIVNKIKTEDYSVDGAAALIGNYRSRALDVFIRGLHQNLAHLIKVQKPSNLPEAYSACLELQNMDYRKSISYSAHSQRENDRRHFNNSFGDNPQRQPAIRNNYEQSRSINFQHKPFIPTNYQGYKQPQPQNNLPPPRPIQPKPPVPMEVDRSIQSAKLNYMNRPGPMVRQANGSSNIPRKNQKLFNMETLQETDPKQEQQDDEEARDEEEYLAHYEEEQDEVNFMMGAYPEFPS